MTVYGLIDVKTFYKKFKITFKNVEYRTLVLICSTSCLMPIAIGAVSLELSRQIEVELLNLSQFTTSKY